MNITAPSTAIRYAHVIWLLTFFLLAAGALSARAGAEDDAQKAALLLALPLEEQGFDFRADVWIKELTPELGKAARVQMFKGNDYRVCVSVPKLSGVQITAHVLDADGKTVETKSMPTKDGTGAVLYVKPPRTGVYLFVVRISGGKTQKTLCAMITGYK